MNGIYTENKLINGTTVVVVVDDDDDDDNWNCFPRRMRKRKKWEN